jgi:hypothetical protein
MAAGGECLIPYVLTSQDSRSLRVDLQKYEIESGRYLMTQQSQTVYVDAKIFAKFLKLLFLLYVAKSRSEREIDQGEAALLMDNCCSHPTSEVMDMLITVRARIVSFVWHTARIFQALDLTF